MREVLHLRVIDDRDVDRAAALRPALLIVVAPAAGQDRSPDREQDCDQGKARRPSLDVYPRFEGIGVRVRRHVGAGVDDHESVGSLAAENRSQETLALTGTGHNAARAPSLRTPRRDLAHTERGGSRPRPASAPPLPRNGYLPLPSR